MDFSLKEETILLKDSAERYLKEKFPSTILRNTLKDEKGFPRNVWKDMADMGWLGLIFDEKYGGSSGSIFDLVILFQEMGRFLLPSPFFCSIILSGLLIQEAGEEKLKEEYLPALIKGEKILTLALLDENGRYDYEKPRIKAQGSAKESYLINGARNCVPFANVAHEILICADTGEGRSSATIFRVGAGTSGQEIIPLEAVTGGKLFAIVYKDAMVSAGNVLGELGAGSKYLNKIVPKATLLKCGEMLGGLERILEMTVDYAKQRRQFGRPIGSLQIIQHYCVDMSTYLETSKLITYQAASMMLEGTPCSKEISMAKAWCSEAYKKATWTAHQIHGAIGFSEEHDLQLFYKHAKAAELELGDSRVHRKKIADEMGI